MGMHIGFIAAKTSVAKLREAFSNNCTDFEIIVSDGNFPSLDAIKVWRKSHGHYVTTGGLEGDLGRDVYVLWQDGPWAIMMEDTYVLPSDEEILAQLSMEFGTVLSFVVETTGGCAYFCCFENGKLRRKIDCVDTDVSSEGDPLPEEADIDISSNYYMDETEALWRAFGLSPFDGPSSRGYQAIGVIDPTDESEQVQPPPSLFKRMTQRIFDVLGR